MNFHLFIKTSIKRNLKGYLRHLMEEQYAWLLCSLALLGHGGEDAVDISGGGQLLRQRSLRLQQQDQRLGTNNIIKYAL